MEILVTMMSKLGKFFVSYNMYIGLLNSPHCDNWGRHAGWPQSCIASR